jgi:MFS family permease
VLIAPMVGLDSITLTFLVVQAFGAAAIGIFGSIPLTFLGGLLIGVAASLSTNYVVDVSWLSGVPASLPVLVLLVALFVIPKRRLVPLTRIEISPRLQYRGPARVRLVAATVALVPLLIFPQVVGANLPFYTEALITAILLLSLGLLVRTSGQVSLCHATFASVGAVAFSQFALGTHLPWLMALVACGLVTMVIGALVAIPAICLSGLFLALATLGFAASSCRACCTGRAGCSPTSPPARRCGCHASRTARRPSTTWSSPRSSSPRSPSWSFSAAASAGCCRGCPGLPCSLIRYRRPQPTRCTTSAREVTSAREHEVS